MGGFNIANAASLHQPGTYQVLELGQITGQCRHFIISGVQLIGPEPYGIGGNPLGCLQIRHHNVPFGRVSARCQR